MKVRRLYLLPAIFVLSFLLIASASKDQDGFHPSTTRAVLPVTGHALSMPSYLPPASTKDEFFTIQFKIEAAIVFILLGETSLILYLIRLNRHSKTLLEERDRAITELTENKTILSGIFNEAPLFMILSDLQGKYYKTNPLFEKTFGDDFHYILQQIRASNSVLEQFGNWEEFKNYLFDMGNASIEENFHTLDGSPILLHISITPIHINDQTYLLSIGQDLNQQKQLEEEQQRTQFAVERSSIAIFLADDHGRITYANQYASQELGYSLAELQQMNIWQLETDPKYAYDTTSWMKDWEQFRNNKRLMFTTEYKCKDGDIIDVAVSSNYFELNGQEFTWIFANNINRIKFAENEAIRAREALEHAYLETIQGWAKALELRDFETAGHTQRVTRLALAFARELNFTHEQTLDLERGSILHDIGKLGVPDSILLKPGKLDPEERKIIEKHPVIGYEMIKDIPFLRKASLIARYHHEKWDGTGYPDRLVGVEIPLNARIFAVIDVWDALLSNRPYHAPWDPRDAEAYMREQSGKHFDPELLTIFFERIIPAEAVAAYHEMNAVEHTT